MSTSEQNREDRIKAMENLRKIYWEIWQRRGVDLSDVIAKWTTSQIQRLPSPGAREEFEELCEKGCAPSVLAAIIEIFRLEPRLNNFVYAVLGNYKTRRNISRRLDTAATMIEESLCDFLAVEDSELRQKLIDNGRLPPSQIISEIRMYRDLFTYVDYLAGDFDVDSLGEFARYLLVAYVTRATETFNDRQLSGLLAEVKGPRDYSEEAQRMWRFRNKRTVEKHFSRLADMLLDLGIVISGRT